MASSGDVVAPVKSVDKLKYLEKYMSGKEKKKKKRVKPSSTQRLRILDDDVDLKHIPSAQSREATPEEDEPVVASVIDDRPLQARVAEQYTPAQWKKIGKDAGKEDVGAFSAKRPAEDSDESPPRKRQACYRSRHDSDSDLSPERPSANAESPPKHEERSRSHRNRGTPPVESNSSRRKPSPQKARQRSSDSDVSPPRRPSPHKARQRSSDSDVSPPRRPSPPSRSKRDTEETSKKHHSSSSKHKRSDDAPSVAHKHRKEQAGSHRTSSPDISGAKDARVKVKVEPPDETAERRNSRNKNDGKHSRSHASHELPDQPSKSRRGHADSEYSSSKNKSHKHDKRRHSPSHAEVRVKVEPRSPSSDRNVERKSRMRHDSDSDLSPVRTSGAAENIDSDLSPERPRRTSDNAADKRRHDSDSDLSPPRPGKMPERCSGSDSDLTPARQPRCMSESPVPFKLRGSDPVKVRHPDGSGHYLAEPGELLEKFRERSKQTPHKSRKVTRKNSPSESKHKSEKHRKEERESTKSKEVEKVQEVVKLRDTTKADKAKEKAAKEAEMAAIYSKWGKGLAQQEQQDQNLADHLHEMSKPFSRYEDDEDLEKHLKDQEREGDPMLNYIRKKKKKQGGDGASGRPTYSGPEPPPNRYGIRPGYRWDGVDRSNGFEKKLIESKNNKKAVEEIAYKWSVEDL